MLIGVGIARIVWVVEVMERGQTKAEQMAGIMKRAGRTSRRTAGTDRTKNVCFITKSC
jgi:hypothetical protein